MINALFIILIFLRGNFLCSSLMTIFVIGVGNPGNKINDTNAGEMQESIAAEMNAPFVSLCKMIVVACFSFLVQLKTSPLVFPAKLVKILPL